MADLGVTTTLPCGIERAYELSRRVGVHERAMAGYDERVVDGPADGVLEAGDRVTRESRHLGMTVTRTIEVVAATPPLSVREREVDGPFVEFVHDHEFERIDATHTLVDDAISYRLPGGRLGEFVDRRYLNGYLRRVLRERNRQLERIAETTEES
ncbi:SRPBCC family protein [Halorubrum sp. DTA98]|uniref:SRPBCC family protein n=1 Tax=Halorubrum sp. DTA98 TaxID=3402163 RepID=UPI003AAB5BE5